MKNQIKLLAAFLQLLTIHHQLSTACAQGTAFTYQGQLTAGANLANGSYDLTFAIYDAFTAGNQQGTRLTNSATAVSAGLFTVTLDFGNQFPGANRWLEIGVRTNGAATYTTLAPRQQLMATPYSVTAGQVTGTVAASQLTGPISGNGVGLTNLNGANITSGTIADVELSTNVALRVGGNTFSGNQSIAGAGTLQLGAGIAGQDAAAGKIGYGTYTPGVLDIVGAGTNNTSRRIKLWAEGGTILSGPLQLESPNGVSLANSDAGAGNQQLWVREGSRLAAAPTNVVVRIVPYNGAGIGYIDAYTTDLSTPTNLVFNPNGGNVGIGTLNPQSTLQVAGTVTANSAVVDGTVVAYTVNSDTVIADNVQVAASVTAGNVQATGTVTASAFAGNWQQITGTNQQMASNVGYLANNASQVVFFLPSAPSVGDIVRVSGVGAGGWQIRQNNGQTILWANLGLVGANWTAQGSSGNWMSVASSADGTRLTAGAYNDGVYISTDSGATWQKSLNGVGRFQVTVNSSADGSKLNAAFAGSGSGGTYHSSNSGLNWQPSGGPNNLVAIASSSDGSKIVAVQGFGQIYTTTGPFFNWTSRDPNNRNYTSVASSADGSKLIAAATGGLGAPGGLFISTNSGQTWATNRTGSWIAVASSADGSKLAAAAASGAIYTSDNSGADWAAATAAGNWSSVACSADGNRLIAAIHGGRVYVSTDSGVTWPPQLSDQAWESVACSSDGSKLCAVGGYDTITPVPIQIYTSGGSSTAGTNGFLSGGQSSAVELQYIGNNQFLPLSHEGTITGF